MGESLRTCLEAFCFARCGALGLEVLVALRRLEAFRLPGLVWDFRQVHVVNGPVCPVCGGTGHRPIGPFFYCWLTGAFVVRASAPLRGWTMFLRNYNCHCYNDY